MTCHRSSEVSLTRRNCPAALVYRRQGLPEDTSWAQVGVAAHACLEAAWRMPGTWRRAVDEAYRQLISHGRRFEGRQEPPIPADQAAQGRRLALNWLAEEPPSEDVEAHPEIGLAVTDWWEPCEYQSDEARWSGIVDLVRFDYMEHPADGREVRVAIVDDYKTDWPAGGERLESLQMRGAACLVQAHFRDVEALVVRIINLRTRRAWDKWIDLDLATDEGRVYIEDSREEILLACEGLDDLPMDDPMAAARPGRGCLTCPFAQHCVMGQDWLERAWNLKPGATGLVAMAALYVRFSAAATALREALKRLDEPIPLPDKRRLGWWRKPVSAPDLLAAPYLARTWLEVSGVDQDRSNLAGFAAAADLTSWNVRRLLKFLRKQRLLERDELEALEKRLLISVGQKEWGIYDPHRDDAT